jgi:hypothetical protein
MLKLEECYRLQSSKAGNKTSSYHSKEKTFIALIRGAGSNVKRGGGHLLLDGKGHLLLSFHLWAAMLKFCYMGTMD